MRRDFMKKVKDLESYRIEEQETRPRVDVGPIDDFSQWVAEHRDQVRSIVCRTPEFRDLPFCGSGYH